jgi:signal transduction histidine kinase
LLTFSHADTYNEESTEPVNISYCIKEALRLIKLSPDTRALNFEVSMPEQALVKGDVNLLMQVFVNLINNACDASPEGSTVSIKGILYGNEIIVNIIDQGSGIEEPFRDQIFEPFFTTKAVGQGTGLGLSLAYSIVSRHEGRLRLGDTKTGTNMIVTLPLSKQP